MQRLLAHTLRYWLASATAAACLLTAAPAAAQVGTAVTPLNIQVSPAAALIGFTGQNQVDAANSAGGITLFSAYVPNGPLLGRLPYLPPFDNTDPDSSALYSLGYTGIPAGTYYVAVVYGIVNAPTIPAAAWNRLVVPGACTGAPGVGLVDRESAGAEPNAVRLFISSFGGCATSYLVEAGTSPGAANVASFEQTGVLIGAAGVPPGNYYVRVRGRNQFGIGPYSVVLPVSVPGCPSGWTEINSDLTATVVGHQVTLSWTPPTPAPQHGGPVTYYELARLDGPRPAGSPPEPFLIPASVTSVSVNAPSGTYTVGLSGGNTCRSDVLATVVFTVP